MICTSAVFPELSFLASRYLRKMIQITAGLLQHRMNRSKNS